MAIAIDYGYTVGIGVVCQELNMSSGNKAQRIIPAGEFKNRCLALMDEVNETGAEIVITKHG